jgi:hypothetical protein
MYWYGKPFFIFLELSLLEYWVLVGNLWSWSSREILSSVSLLLLAVMVIIISQL